MSEPPNATSYSVAILTVPILGGTPATAVSSPVYAFTIDSSSIYWWTGSSTYFMSMPFGGGASDLFTIGHECWDISVSDGYVYCCDSIGLIMRVPVGGGSATTLATGVGFLSEGLAVNSTNLYWTRNSSIWSLPVTGGTPVAVATNQGALGVPPPVLDASFVYWTTAATVMRAPLAGGSSVELASGQNSPIGLAIDAGSLYWMNTNGSLMRVTK
jgi:hypothetical protein